MSDSTQRAAAYDRLQRAYGIIAAEPDRMATCAWLLAIAKRLAGDDIEMRTALAWHMRNIAVALDSDVADFKALN